MSMKELERWSEETKNEIRGDMAEQKIGFICYNAKDERYELKINNIVEHHSEDKEQLTRLGDRMAAREGFQIFDMSE